MNNANDEMFEFMAQYLTRRDILWSRFKGKMIAWFYNIKNGGKRK